MAWDAIKLIHHCLWSQFCGYHSGSLTLPPFGGPSPWSAIWERKAMELPSCLLPYLSFGKLLVLKSRALSFLGRGDFGVVLNSDPLSTNKEYFQHPTVTLVVSNYQSHSRNLLKFFKENKTQFFVFPRSDNGLGSVIPQVLLYLYSTVQSVESLIPQLWKSLPHTIHTSW